METMTAIGERPDGSDVTLLRTGRIGRRLVAFGIDATVLAYCIALGLLGIAFIDAIMTSTLGGCATSDAPADCEPSIWIARFIAALAAMWIAASVHLVLVVPAWRNGATLGMRQVGIRIVSHHYGAVVSQRQFHLRAWVSHSSAIVLILVLVSWVIGPAGWLDRVIQGVAIAGGVVIVASAVLILLPGHRSIADSLTATRVIVERPVSYIAHIAAIVCSVIGQALLSVATAWTFGRPDEPDLSFDFGNRRHDDFDWASDPLERLFAWSDSATSNTIALVVCGAIWLAAVGLCWAGLVDTRWHAERNAGRGVALVACLYAALPILVLTIWAVTRVASILIDAFG